MRAKPKTTYVTASPATWELIRATYLSGLSAPTAAARFGVSVGALRKRAQREGWTKRAYVAGGPLPVLAGPGAAAEAVSAAAANRFGLPPDLAELEPRLHRPVSCEAPNVARTSLRMAVRALADGDPLAALRHARAAQQIARLDALLPYCDDDEDPTQVEARQTAFLDFTFSVAGELATALMTGQSVLPGYLTRADEWRRRHEANAAARAAAESESEPEPEGQA